MSLILLAIVGGVLTILSPCILPILPFLFTQADRTFARHGAPLLGGLAVSFVGVTALGVLGARWIVTASDVGHWAALAALALVGLTLAAPSIAERLARPLVRIGAGVAAAATSPSSRTGSFGVGLATGLLWAPCAGPILGLLIAGAAVQTSPGRTVALLAAFAFGTCLALAVVIVAGHQLTRRLVRTAPMQDRMRRLVGVAVIAGVVAVALGWDRTLLARGSFVQTAAAEELLVRRLGRPPDARPAGKSLDEFVADEAASPALTDEGEMPEFNGATAWLNSPPLTRAQLRGKVVLVDFWTFECINCLHALPYVKALHAKYAAQGLVVIGVHTPEFPRERVRENVERELKKLDVAYAVPLDNDYAIWKAFHNEYWPAAYFVDKYGRIRFHHFGEGRYDDQEKVVQKLLAEPGPAAGR